MPAHDFDNFVLWLVTPLAAIFLLSGLDDIAVDLAWFYAWAAERLTVSRRDPRHIPDVPPRPIAILVPLWKEHAVIARMLEHNLAAIRYPDFHIFAGIYANDGLTEEAVASISERFNNVHLAVCPHDGPTSKADCLNWIYQHVGLYEEQNGIAFEVFITHDAEDLIHPEELCWINAYATQFGFIQLPVLALATPFWSFTHGVYCDEFAEYHTRDMVVRSSFGCFVPGSGVGTGYSRDALDALARACENRVFEPASLTEDYESGLRLYRLGCGQVFVPLTRLKPAGRDFVATREFFPTKWTTALAQRTRWVLGIALQGWERFGWAGTRSEMYWLWRDRKGLLGNPLGVVANAVFLYGLTTAMWTRMTPLATELTAVTLAFQAIRIAIRMGCVARVYGFVFALGVPLRLPYANLLNAAATIQAVARYANARIRRIPLRWIKTEHSYPTRAALLSHKRPLGEILQFLGYLDAPALQAALAACPPGKRLGAFLVASGELNEVNLYEALSLQQGLPIARIDPSEVRLRVARALPERIVREWRVLPFKIADGSLLLASPDLPTAAMTAAVRPFTALEIRFHLLAPSDYKQLVDALL
ncbi:MAG: glycosyl transferase family protein [Acidobacteriota bacterium]|nr:glycosyl transferase family protein [Acidobacteriota bacterium]